MDIPVSKVRKILKIAQEPISLETPIGEEEDSHLGLHRGQGRGFAVRCSHQFELEGTNFLRVEDSDAARGKSHQMRFGLDDGSEHTLEEVGQSFASLANASARSRPRRFASCATVAFAQIARVSRRPIAGLPLAPTKVKVKTLRLPELFPSESLLSRRVRAAANLKTSET